MLSSKAQTMWLVVIFMAYSSSAPSINKSLQKSFVKHYDFSKHHEVSYIHLSNNGSHITFGLGHGNDSTKSWLITQNSLTSMNETCSCLVTIKATAENSKIDENVVVAHLLNDRALVMSKEGHKLKLINVNLRGCDKKEAELVTDEHILVVNVVAHENSYDVFFVNSELCQRRSCRVTFDIDGNIAKEAAAWGDDFVDDDLRFQGLMQSVAHRSADSGFIVKNMVLRSEPYVFFITNEGKKRLTVRSGESAGDVAISTFGNYIGTCSNDWIREPGTVHSHRILECKKFDFDGRLVKSELRVNTSSLVGDDNKIIHFMARLDLPEGFLIFTVLCPLKYYSGCTGSESYFVYHLDGNGKMLKTIEINDFECQKGTDFSILRAFVNDAGEKCVTLECTNWPVQQLTTGVRCFTNDELQ